jgi:hypothetical protein
MDHARIRLIVLLSMLGSCALAPVGRAAYPRDPDGRDLYFSPLRAWTASLGDEFTLWAIGDSWTCNAQHPGEAVNWSSEFVGGGASSAHNAIWGDPTSCNGTTWLARLAWRLRTHVFGAEAIGGAQLTNNHHVPFQFEEDVTIASWIDDAAAFDPDLALFYGGINDILGSNASYQESKMKLLGCAERMYDVMPERTRFLFLSLQPCGKNYLRGKMRGQAPWGTMSWRAVLDSCLSRQLVTDRVNEWLLDSLRHELARPEHGARDTTRLFCWDHVGQLQGSWQPWMQTREAGDYLLDLGGVSAEQGFPPSVGDSLRWAGLRILRREIESDSIHANQRGLRQIGDSLAAGAFGLDLATWQPGAPRTLYVDKALGHNWQNRGRETQRAHPLATLQCAVTRAWPRDTLHVIGVGNQALLTPSSSGPSPCSIRYYEVVVNKPDLTFRFDEGAYYEGVYNAAARLYGSSSPVAVGSGLFHQDAWSGGDDRELVTGRNWSGTDPSRNVLIEMGRTVFDGLRVRGYSIPVLLPNVSGLTFRNCEFYGGRSSEGCFQVYGYGVQSQHTPLELKLEACTFYSDSSATEVTNSAAWGRLTFGDVGAIGDSTTYSGWIRDCRFMGSSDNSSSSLVKGIWDGIDFVGNQFIDPLAGAYVVENTRTNAQPSKPWLRRVKFVNNTFDCESSASSLTAIRCQVTVSSRVDSVLLMNNIFRSHGPVRMAAWGGAFDPGRSWFARNISPSWNTWLRDGNSSARSLGQLIALGAAPDSLAVPSQGNWAGVLSAAGDSLRAGGLLSTAKGNTWVVADYGVRHAPGSVSLGATQFAPLLVDLTPPRCGGGLPGGQPLPAWQPSRLLTAGVVFLDDESGVDGSSVSWRLDRDQSGSYGGPGEEWQPVTGLVDGPVVAVTVSVELPGDGEYRVEFRAWDLAGNGPVHSMGLEGTGDDLVLRVDATPPTASVLTLESVEPDQAVLAFTTPEEARFARYEIRCSRDVQVDESDRLWSVEEDPALALSGTTRTLVTGLPPAADWYFRLWSVDAAGNRSPASNLVHHSAPAQRVAVRWR